MRAIDADALVAKYGNWYTEEGSEEGFIGTIKSLVDTMPTIEPERKKGKWIHRGCGMFECDQCGKKLISNVYTCEGAGHLYKYCPGCGADMRGEQDEQAT